MNQLEGDITLEPRVAGPVHLAHAARANLRGDFVGADHRAALERHARRRDPEAAVSDVHIFHAAPHGRAGVAKAWPSACDAGGRRSASTPVRSGVRTGQPAGGTRTL